MSWWYDNVFLGYPEEDEEQRLFDMVEEEVTEVLINSGFETVVSCLLGSDSWVNGIEALIAERKNNF